MDRRDVLKLGALASVGSSGCASLLSNPASVGTGEMSGFLSALDDAMGAVAADRSFDRYLAHDEDPEATARVKRSEELTKKTLRSLLLVGTVQELPPALMAHEGVQQRLRSSMGEFDDAMFGMTSMLEGLSTSERASVSKALRDDPQLGMRIMGSLDEEAAAFGVSLKQRTKLRAVSTQACARLRQSPDLAIAEYTGKMHKVAARHGARAEAERRAAAAIGSSLVFEGQEWNETSTVQPASGGNPAGWTDPPVTLPPATDQKVSCTTPADCAPGFDCQDYRPLGGGKWTRGACVPEPKKEKSSPAILTAGGIALGLAVTGFAVLAATGSVGVLIGATVGGVLGLIGIIILVVGLIVRANGH